MSTAIYSEPALATSTPPLQVAVQPTVSVIVPCYNEEKFIGKALENLVHQYESDAYEIVVVDGMSTDRTRQVVEEFERLHPRLRIKLLENPARAIPHALNLGIAAARGEIIARMDAHAAPSAGYIRGCVAALRASEAAVVGMPCRVRAAADTAIARSIAIAVSHPFGIGDAKYRLGNQVGRIAGADSRVRPGSLPEEVDTVAFACFRKSLWLELGGFDERLLTNEDYDFNYRVRARGGRVVLDHAAHCDYFARPTLAKLAAQYFRYGTWKARMIRRRPRSTKLRQLVAPAFVISLALLGLAGLWRAGFWMLLALEVAVYLVAACMCSFTAARKNHEGADVMLAMPAAFFAIHLSWGASFLWGIITPTGKS
ncbi:MAG TPA: glycosyltransferase family 2 protein [Pyrinomonadaceae bacterium]